MSGSNLSSNQSRSYEAPASELIVIDCKGSMMQGVISNWEHGGDFSSPFESPREDSAGSGFEFVLIGDSENN